MQKGLATYSATNLALFGWVFSGASSEIAPTELVLVAAMFVVIAIVQSILATGVRKLLGSLPFKVTLAFFLAANVYFLGMVPLESPLHLKVLYSVGAGIALLVLLILPDALNAPVVIAASVIGCLSIGEYAYGRATLAPPAGFAGISMPVKSDRNVYLISFESLHSPQAFRELYGVTHLPHVGYLREKGFRILDSAYSVDTATKPSYMRLLEFGKVLLERRDLSGVFVRGNSTFTSFRDSGYAVQWLYVSDYLPFTPSMLDYKFPPAGMFMCDNLPPEFLYFYCSAPMVSLVNQAFYKVNGQI